MRRPARGSGGWTVLELTIVIAVTSIMSVSIAAIFIPQINSYFHLVASSTTQSAAADVAKIIVEGDALARGLRFADPKSPIISASGDSLTYRYYDLTQTSADTPHTVVLTYVLSDRVVTRSVDSGPADYVPYFVKPGGPIVIDPLETDFFIYLDSAGNQLTDPVDVSSIRRVNMSLEASYASGRTDLGGAKIRIKTGVFIKRSV